jgi:hybrid cluster-associated redox disulfide protein
MKQTIKPSWKIQKVLEEYPYSADVLIKYGFHCIGCAMAQYETLEQGAEAHDLDKKQLKKLIEELNKLDEK